MPSSVHHLISAAELEYGGVVDWGRPPPTAEPGVYALSLVADPNSISGVLPNAPISSARIAELLDARPELTIDGARPDTDLLISRISEFWLPDENILYIGLAGTSLADRVNAYYSTRLGRRSPHAGGWFIKLLDNLDRLRVHYAVSVDPNRSEGLMLETFVANVSSKTQRALRDPTHPFPYANLEWPKGVQKDHGIRRATGSAGPGRPPTTAGRQASDTYPRPADSRTDNVMRINLFLQDELRRRDRTEVPAVEAARWLDDAGLLRDSPIRPGLPLRDLLRAELIEGQRQEPNRRWFVDRLGR